MIRRYRIPTQRGYFTRLAESFPFIVALYAAVIVGLILLNLEKFV